MHAIDYFLPNSTEKQETLRISSLHALAYCPRLFYLEEVEELYTQNAEVFAGRRLHTELEKQEDEDWEDLYLESEELGLRGRVDALRTRDGQTIPYEHKRGRCHRDENKQPQAWDSDKLQILAYCCLLESALGIVVSEGRIRYHADNVLVTVPLDDEGRNAVREAVEKARSIRQSLHRPPVTENERLCAKCSLSPVCLPEEARLSHDKEWQPIRLFPQDDDRQILHIPEAGTAVGRTGEQLKITRRNQPIEKVAIGQIEQVVLHSFSQISTQAMHFCAGRGIGIHFISGGGRYIGSFDSRQGSIQRRIRQYQALSQPETCLELARKLVSCRGGGQRKFLMRGLRGMKVKSAKLERAITQMKSILKQIPKTASIDSLLGVEGSLGALYFGALPCLIQPDVPPELHFSGRNRRPPKDRFNALLSFGYALLIKDVINAILTVGLESALGFYHQPRSQAAPLALDLMEIFRVPLVDMPVMAAVNRGQWDVAADFEVRGSQVWLSDGGRRKFIGLYEQRKAETWKHPAMGYSLTYRRLLELEVRLLEKEWMGEGGLFAQLVLR
ncbi:MAG TPA: type I-MYXAN CRISPR-associated endonuclease Cas1 [Oscillatoriales cyanobacterium M59_W2019_021]|nr:type I-MYXAN CRISPR-associated endonuclease Cas1 [Oscillatoriales cyanobacterium M59_W2019_021]